MNYNINECNFKDFVIGSGWPCYKKVSVKEMTDIMYPPETPTTPRYDTEPGNSRIDERKTFNDVISRDARLMKELYSQLNKILAPLIERILDEYEYIDSPIYDEDGIDRETLAQLVAKVIALADDEMDETQEIRLETNVAAQWNRNDLLNSLVQSLLLAEIFLVRRPRYRRARNNYVYSSGLYKGVRPQ